MSNRSTRPLSRPKLMCFGDPHGDFRFVIDCVLRHAPEAVILLGDLQPARPLHLELGPILDKTEVWFVHGNHDTDTDQDHDNIFHSELAHRNLHGRVADVAGLRVAGLGGVFRESIWAPPLPPVYRSVSEMIEIVRRHERWRGGSARRHRSSIFYEDYERLMSRRADVLVTHEGLGGTRNGWSALDDLAAALGVQVAVHGHLHRQIDYAAERRLPAGCRYKAYGVDRNCAIEWPGGQSFVQEAE